MLFFSPLAAALGMLARLLLHGFDRNGYNPYREGGERGEIDKVAASFYKNLNSLREVLGWNSKL
mgnify:CR=1 FL=1